MQPDQSRWKIAQTIVAVSIGGEAGPVLARSKKRASLLGKINRKAAMTLPQPEAVPLTHTTRRNLFKLTALGLAGASTPLLAKDAARGFTHGVASGEPGANQVLLWTRYVGSGDVGLTFEVAEDEQFTRAIASGECTAAPGSDYCAKAWARGLAPGKWYFYRFIAPSGEMSCVGRTRTLPVGPTARFRIAVFSCSNYGFGHFNAYAHAAETNEFDLAVHLGDYFYEYERGEYPTLRQVIAERHAPLQESVSLAQYRERFALYRSDPDLRRIHQLYPLVSVWDDHETANDPWVGGAENHQSEKEGDWATRKAASERAYREWMPVSDDYWASYEVGDLASLMRLETRHVARSQQLDLESVFGKGPVDQAGEALARFRDGAWRDPARELLGGSQQAWLGEGLKASHRSGKPWQVLLQQVVMGELRMAPRVLEGMTAQTPEWLRNRLQRDVAASKAGLPLNLDAWDGYPAARDRLYKAALDADANLVVLTGDTHNAWAFDLDRKGQRVGVEMAGQSVTSPGAEGSIPWLSADDLARDSVATNAQLKWCELASRGYMAVELTPGAASCEWRFLTTVRQKGTALSGVKRMTVLAGQKRFSA